jgi:hypothetical protein
MSREKQVQGLTSKLNGISYTDSDEMVTKGISVNVKLS